MLIDTSVDAITVHPRDWPSPSAELIRDLYEYPVAVIGDAMHRMGMMGSRINAIGNTRCVGPALTVWTREGDNLAIHRALGQGHPGDILVVNGAGDETRALFGDLLAQRCQQIGIVGVVVDGCIRDAHRIADLGFPVWSAGISPAGPTKNGPGVVGDAVACGGVVVRPGDVIAGDTDGVAVIPFERAAQISVDIAGIEEYEAGLRANGSSGAPR